VGANVAVKLDQAGQADLNDPSAQPVENGRG
jgi:hypothetical protein